MTAAIADRLQSGPPPRVLLLGATPELATLPWPSGTELVAVDRARAVLDNVFPTEGVPAQTSCLAADWLSLPFDDDRFDVVLGDGALTCLDYPEGYRGLARELRRVVVDDARVVLRIFTAPAHPESLDDLAPELRSAAVHSFHALKWRIGMAIQGPERSVAVADILAAFERLVPDWPSTAAACGWSLRLIDTIEPYRQSAARYSFPTIEEVRASLAADLAWIDSTHPSYELGDRCPTVRLGPLAR